MNGGGEEFSTSQPMVLIKGASHVNYVGMRAGRCSVAWTGGGSGSLIIPAGVLAQFVSPASRTERRDRCVAEFRVVVAEVVRVRVCRSELTFLKNKETRDTGRQAHGN